MPNTIKVVARSALIRLFNPRLILGARKRKAVGEIKRIVVVRPDHLGDLLFATPALEVIRAAFPDARITGLVGPWGRAMWQDNPNLDALEVVRFPGIAGKEKGALQPYRLLSTTARKIRAQRFDLGIVLRFDHWWGATMLAAAGVPRRWGYDTPGMKKWLTHVVVYEPGRHEVEQNLRLVEQVMSGESAGRRASVLPKIDRARGLPKLRPPEAEPVGDEMLGGWPGASRKVVIHPGTTAANKLWTVSGWAEVARKLMDEGLAIAITGTPAEKPLANAIVDEMARRWPGEKVPVNMAGRTANIGQLVWVLEQAHMVLGVDNGPLHIADALGKPSLHLYGPSEETIWGTWGDPAQHRAFRAPGTRPTMQLDTGSTALEGGPEMRAISAEMVMREVGYLKRITDII